MISVTFLQADITVESNEGTEVFERMEASGTEIKFYKKGEKFSFNKQIRNIERIVQPAPPQVQSMLKAFRDKKFAAIAEKGGSILKNNEHKGWGRMLSYIYATSLNRSGKAKEAVRVIEAGRFLIKGAGEDGELLLKCALAESHFVQKTGKAEKILADKVPVSEFGKAAFYFIQGSIFEEQKKPNTAVLAYYKSIMIGRDHPDCSESVKKVNSIYKKLDDPRKLPMSLLSSK
jgi:hypothetical protein